jgi:hypothetical protein
VIAARALCWRKRVDVANCRATAEFLERRHPTGAAMLYNAACCRALVAAAQAESRRPGDARLAKKLSQYPAESPGRPLPAPLRGTEIISKEEADRARAWLTQAVAAGFKNAARLREDAALDSLRDREDFRKLQAGLEAKAAAGWAPVPPPRARD